MPLSLKRKTNVQNEEREEPSDGVPAPKVRAHVESTKLRELLSNLGSNEE